MIKVHALAFLFLIQFLLIFLGLSVFLFLRHKKVNTKVVVSQGEIRRLESEIDNRKKEIAGLLRWKDMFNDLQQKFEKMKSINKKLMETIDVLVPEAERSKEFAELLVEMEQSKKDLDSCIGTLQKENEALSEQMRFSRDEIAGLSGKLKESVSKKDFQKVLNEKMGLETKVHELEEELKMKTKEYEKLEKNFVYLEKEYNALYRNVKGEEP